MHQQSLVCPCNPRTSPSRGVGGFSPSTGRNWAVLAKTEHCPSSGISRDVGMRLRRSPLQESESVQRAFGGSGLEFSGPQSEKKQVCIGQTLSCLDCSAQSSSWAWSCSSTAITIRTVTLQIQKTRRKSCHPSRGRSWEDMHHGAGGCHCRCCCHLEQQIARSKKSADQNYFFDARGKWP